MTRAAADSASSYIPSVSPCSHHMTTEHNLTAWHEAAKPLFSIKIRNPDQYSSSTKAYLLNQTIFTAIEFKAQTFIRQAQQIKQGASDHLVLELYLVGQGTGYIGNEQIEMCPQRINLLDYHNPLRTVVSDASVISFTIPRDLVRCSALESRPARFWDTVSPSGRILSCFMRELWTVLPKTESAHAATLENSLVGLLNGLLSEPSRQTGYERECVQKSSLAAIQAFIETHLHLPSLGTAQLCKTFHLSRSSLYRLFKDCGGVEHYIKQQQLKQAFHKLVDGRPGLLKTPIYNIAVECGFTDPAHFSRLFKQTFGVTPSDVFYSNSDSGESQQYMPHLEASNDSVETLKSWFTQA